MTLELEVLSEDDTQTPCINTDDLFTFEPLQFPIVKIRFPNGKVYGYSLDSLARWLAFQQTDPIVRSAHYTEDQVLDIRRRFGYYTFLDSATKSLTIEWVERLKATRNNLEQLKAVFQQMDNVTLTITLFSAYRVSFRIFCEIYRVGKERNLFNLTTLELLLSESSTDHDDPHNKNENSFFTVRLVRLLSSELHELPPKSGRKHTVRQAIGHFAVCAHAPCLRPYLLHVLITHKHLLPKRTIRALNQIARHQSDPQLADILLKYRLIVDGLVPSNHPQVRSLIEI